MSVLSWFTTADAYILLCMNYLFELLTTTARRHTAGIFQPGFKFLFLFYVSLSVQTVCQFVIQTMMTWPMHYHRIKIFFLWHYVFTRYSYELIPRYFFRRATVHDEIFYATFLEHLPESMLSKKYLHCRGSTWTSAMTR